MIVQQTPQGKEFIYLPKEVKLKIGFTKGTRLDYDIEEDGLFIYEFKKVIRCPMCNRPFKDKDKLRKHMDKCMG